jgi:hypothetical protein
MAEVLRSVDGVLEADGVGYVARVVGRQGSDGMWEGWLEFAPVTPAAGDAPVLATGVETRQPAWEHLTYWATGLSGVYVEGAFDRARDPLTVTARARERPLTEAPAPRPLVTEEPPPVDAVLDPFEIGSRSLSILRQELSALNRPRLLNIIAAYDLNPAANDLSWMTDAQLATFIVTAVEAILVRGR